VRRAFGKLMDMLDEREHEPGTTLGDLAKEYGEPVERIMDALDANKERRGEVSYIDVRTADD
jgi:hypothetical protein